MCVSCLQKYAVLLKEKHVDNNLNKEDTIQIDPYQKELGYLIMDIVTSLIFHNIANASMR
jgi:hypothetical protein